ncbi:radical SAM protein [Actinomadura rugatobispora]|uniref:Radical SAM protein n=1 Tax=Actinomadura rugatobispora TaxID=1994 RepID=A0ABW0ZUD8_9ACTN|nr:hypothetical protein GCM10010200_017190 [Actinomadura rugatobispora]
MNAPAIELRLLLAERCDLACVFCHNEGQPGRDALLAATPDQIAQIVGDLRAWGEVRVKFSGGEPTLHPRLGEYLAAVNAQGVTDATLITNANDPGALGRLAGRRPFRVSVNLPAALAEDYANLTRGSFQAVIASCRLLAESGVEFALNSYWPLRRAPARLVPLVELARELKGTLKILCPCQVTDPDQQRRVLAPLAEVLTGLGYTGVRQEDHKWFFQRGAHVIRLQTPWCPVVCTARRKERRSVRITAAGLIHGCLDSRTQYFGSIYADREQRRRQLGRALDAAGASCAGSGMRVAVLRRRENTARD